MNTHHLLQITTRINLLLLRELGQGIDIWRTMHDRRYARDVLLVCDAQPASGLAALAAQFRSARAVLADTGQAGADAPADADDSGFSHTLSGLCSQDFEVSRPPADAPLASAAAPGRRWVPAWRRVGWQGLSRPA